MSSGLRITMNDGVLRITLARPEIKNAFNAELIAELTQTLRDHVEREDVWAMVIDAEGPMFCAGADFHWMKAQKEASLQANIADSLALYDMFYELYTFPYPTIARVQGGAFGGGVGLVACCDFVIMAGDATVSFSEVKIGLVPATVSPFVIRRIGEGRARELFMTGAVISAARAHEIGLANALAAAVNLDTTVDEYLKRLRACGPGALRVVKELLREVPRLSLADAREFTAKRIAQQRVSEEGQEGMAAFLEKRKPVWTE